MRSEASAERVAAGATEPGTGWQPEAPGIAIDVDTMSAAFGGTPAYACSLAGDSAHWTATGGNAVRQPSATGFRVSLRRTDGSPLVPADAVAGRWHVNWLGVR